ncbi:MAG: DUF2163 domain-containing protein [Pseudomonadota bacterium]
MRYVPESMQAKLDSGATTLCACWRIDPVFGEAMGFTDHDAPLNFDGVTFEASSGFTASGVERSLGLSIDNASARGALQSESLSEIDIRRGKFDGAEIRQWLVDWSDSSSRILTFRGEIGEVKRGPVAFEVELRGMSERLNRPVGRSFLQVCDAMLGDARCGVDAEDPAFRGTGTVAEVVSARSVRVSGIDSFEPNWFDFGALSWTDGVLVGTTAGVRSHRIVGADVIVELDRDFVEAPATADAFFVVAGCDKRLSTCRNKFSNVRNFRGFPYIPGESWVAAYPVEGGVYDGGSRGG